jgi:hypothetical protein
MGAILRTCDTTESATRVAVTGLAAHLLDYFVTLRITPDLAMEANPIWRVVIDNFGLGLARAYGLTGKLLLSVLSAQLFAWHLSHRASLFPARASGVGDFIKQLGKGAPRMGNIRSFFAFAFALFGPYFFYITFMNVTGEAAYDLYEKLPSPPVAILGYFVLVTFAYFATMWRAVSYRVDSAPSGTRPPDRRVPGRAQASTVVLPTATAITSSRGPGSSRSPVRKPPRPSAPSVPRHPDAMVRPAAFR